MIAAADIACIGSAPRAVDRPIISRARSDTIQHVSLSSPQPEATVHPSQRSQPALLELRQRFVGCCGVCDQCMCRPRLLLLAARSTATLRLVAASGTSSRCATRDEPETAPGALRLRTQGLEERVARLSLDLAGLSRS
jgi:hypothetical protein